jgi:exoenzyme U
MDDWVRDALGADPAQYGTPAGGGGPATPPAAPNAHALHPGPGHIDKSVTKAAANPAVWTKSVGRALTKDGPGKPGATITPDRMPDGPAQVCQGRDGKQIKIVKGKDGRVAMTADPPPIREITFSGGGGKGAALPGAVKALAESGVLKQVRELHGASVGSMTAAMLAAGMTPHDFEVISGQDFNKIIGADGVNYGKVVPLIGEDKSRALQTGHDGKGFEAAVAGGMTSAMGKRIDAALEHPDKLDPASVRTLQDMKVILADGTGPTFGQLRRLSKIIPDIKEVVITGTLIGSSGPAKKGEAPGAIKEQKPEVHIFSADTEPDMKVALAVHASAALPPVFKPVEMKLQDGRMARFEDGGVLNNAPSSDTLGTDRDVDTVPDAGKMTFVFQDKESGDSGAHGAVPFPKKNAFADAVAKAPNTAAEYGKSRSLAERTEDVVVVPLTFKDKQGREKDFSGMVSGTVNFNLNPEDRKRLQQNTKDATSAFIAGRQQPVTRTFDSTAQMLCTIPRDELVDLAGDKQFNPDAKEILAFRDAVTKQVAQLEALVAGGAGPADPKAAALLKAINGLAASDQDRLAFVGRALNHSGKLDHFLAAARDTDGEAGPSLDALEAGIAVNDVVLAREIAKKILDKTVYPKLIDTGDKGPAGDALKGLEIRLRRARSRHDVEDALVEAIDFFGDDSVSSILGNAVEAAKNAAKRKLAIKDRAAEKAGEVARAVNEDGVAKTLAKGLLSLVAGVAEGPVPEIIDTLKAAKDATFAPIEFANELRSYLPSLQ